MRRLQALLEDHGDRATGQAGAQGRPTRDLETSVLLGGRVTANHLGLVLLERALDARFDEAAQDLDDDTALLLLDGGNRTAADWRRRNLFKAERRHGVSPRR